MAVTIASIAAKILPELSGSLAVQREQAVVEAIIAFAKRSNIFKFITEHSIDATDVDATENDSVILPTTNLPTNYRPWRIEALSVDGIKKQIYQRTIANGQNISTFNTVFPSGLYFSINNDDTITLFPFPTDTAFATTTGILSIVMDIVCIPNSAITEIDDFFYARWGQAIESGAKALMMMQANQPWTNAPLSAVYAKMFDAATNQALMKRNLEEAGGEMTVEKLNFF